MASFTRSQFYFYATSSAAQGSGQKWAGGAHPWNWNAAGVDYAVGYPAKPGLEDVYKAKSSGAGAFGVLPAACSFQPANTVPGTPYERIFCQRSSGVDITIQGLNFQSAYLGGDCVVLEIATSVTGGDTINIIGDNFHNGSNCNWGANNFMVKIDGGTDNVVFSDNQIDGTYSAYNNTNNQVAMVVANGSGTFTAQYNAVLNAPQRPFATTTSSIIFQYNYINGIVMYSGVEHGEIDENQPSYAQKQELYTYNTILIPKSQPASTDTAPFYCVVPSGQAGLTVQNCEVDHNVVVTNLHAANYTTSAAALEIAYGVFGGVTFTNNYVDGTGAIWCAADTSGSAQNISGNIANNVMTVSSLQAGGYIPVGTTPGGQISYVVGRGVAYQTTILTQVSGAANGVGEYTVGGPAQTTPLMSGNSSPAPILGSLTWSGNYSLVSGKAIPQAWNLPCP